MGEALALYDATRASCEISGPREQRLFLSLLAQRVDSAAAAESLFGHFRHDPYAGELLARFVLRRTLDAYVASVAKRALHGQSIDWSAVDLELAALRSDEERVTRLRALLLAAPSDGEAQLRLMKYLLRANRRAEAIALASRMRERGPLSPTMLRELGDLEVLAGLTEQAIRTYTEIVEFDATSPEARRLVGDTLLAHGWYDVAYRQYRTLVELTRGSVDSQLRLALAAAGTGRTDEALRTLRAVAGGEAEPSADDPRLHARLLASALLARLLASETDGERSTALTRELRQLGLVEAGARLYLLTWDDLEASLGLATTAGEVVDGRASGLFAVTGSDLSLDTLRETVTVRSELARAHKVHYRLHELAFDGKAFQVRVVDGDAG
jgi:Ca-activated chloride channel family protein